MFEESLNVEVDQSEFTNKRWVYVNDNNNGNYTSQIVIDSTPLSNAGGWINWQEGFIMMPLVIQLTSATAGNLPIGTSKADYAWAIKNGFWQMINSMSVEFNNQNIIQQTPFLNVFRSFKAHTSFSSDDLLNEGSTIGYHPDSAGSWAYESQAPDATNITRGTTFPNQARGYNQGLTNNANAQDFDVKTIATLATATTNYPSNGIAGAPALGTASGANSTVTHSGASNPDSRLFNINSYNEGMRQRQSWNSYDVNTGNLNQQAVNAQIACNTVLRSTKDSTVEGVVTWKVYAKLRLKDLAEFFEKCPLLKGSTMRFYINTNQAIVNFTSFPTHIVTATGVIANVARLQINSVNVVGGLTCPLMLASCGMGQGGAPLAVTAVAGETYNLTVSIFKNNFPAQSTFATQTAIGACRLYAPVYTFNPIAESKYLSLAPTRRILYRDIFQYQFNNIDANGSFNFLVSNGISRIKSVLVVPFISKSNTTVSSASNTTLKLPFDSWQNPCNTAPATPDPIMLTNFNILVSGVNLFMNNENYDFEAFRQQLISSNQLNGSLTTGLTSGLISEDMFSRGYRYYYGDCSRTLPSEENVSRSVQIVGQNASLLIADIMVFVEFMKEITVDVSTGARIE